MQAIFRLIIVLLCVVFLTSPVRAWHPVRGDFTWNGQIAPGEVPYPIWGVLPGALQPFYGLRCGSENALNTGIGIDSRDLVPDGIRVVGGGPIIRVYEACEAHDQCYVQHRERGGKEQCDDQFLAHIRQLCEQEFTGGWDILLPECLVKAQLYYEIMRQASQKAYDKSGITSPFDPDVEYIIESVDEPGHVLNNDTNTFGSGGRVHMMAYADNPANHWRIPATSPTNLTGSSATSTDNGSVLEAIQASAGWTPEDVRAAMAAERHLQTIVVPVLNSIIILLQ